jgi:hypothetical protein
VRHGSGSDSHLDASHGRKSEKRSTPKLINFTAEFNLPRRDAKGNRNVFADQATAGTVGQRTSFFDRRARSFTICCTPSLVLSCPMVGGLRQGMNILLNVSLFGGTELSNLPVETLHTLADQRKIHSAYLTHRETFYPSFCCVLSAATKVWAKQKNRETTGYRHIPSFEAHCVGCFGNAATWATVATQAVCCS